MKHQEDPRWRQTRSDRHVFSLPVTAWREILKADLWFRCRVCQRERRPNSMVVSPSPEGGSSQFGIWLLEQTVSSAGTRPRAGKVGTPRGGTNLGKTQFGQVVLPSLAKTKFGQTQYGQERIWPRPSLARPGQTQSVLRSQVGSRVRGFRLGAGEWETPGWRVVLAKMERAEEVPSVGTPG